MTVEQQVVIADFQPGDTELGPGGILGWIERVGNRLPDPASIALLLGALVLILSAVAASSGWTAIDPASGKVIVPVNLLSAEHAPELLLKMLDNFRSFPPVAIGVAIFLGIGIADRSGFLETATTSMLRAVPRRWLTPVVVIVAINSNIITEPGSLFLIPLAGALYASAGRNPLVGISAALVGQLGCLGANLLIAPIDPLLFGITQVGARAIDPHWSANIAGNWFIMAAWALLLWPIVTVITEYVVAPRLEREHRGEAIELPCLKPEQRRGLRFGLVALAGCVVVILAISFPQHALMRDAKGGLDPFLKSLVAIVMVAAIITGWAYGVGAGTVKSYRDVVRMAGQSVADIGPFLVVCFACAQFVAWFSDSRIGNLLAIDAAGALQASNMPAWAILVFTVLFSFVAEMFVTSASVKWAVLSPIAVPTLMLLHISPEAATAAFRIGDSAGGIITPVNTVLPLVLAFGQRYDRKFGLGSLIALMLPYCFAILLSGTVLLVAWQAFGLPLGPNGAVFGYPR